MATNENEARIESANEREARSETANKKEDRSESVNEKEDRSESANENRNSIERANEKEVRSESTNEEAGDIAVVYAYVENSGRLDQIMANIQTLYLSYEYLPHNPVYLINSESISWLLQPGRHVIHLLEEVLSSVGIDTDLLLNSLHCGLIPLSGPTLVTTIGLKWNLTRDELKFGALVSTSNAFASKDIMVETDKPLLWTMDIIK